MLGSSSAYRNRTDCTPTLVGAELHRRLTPRGSCRATAGMLNRLSTRGKAVSGTAYSPGISLPPVPDGAIRLLRMPPTTAAVSALVVSFLRPVAAVSFRAVVSAALGF